MSYGFYRFPANPTEYRNVLQSVIVRMSLVRKMRRIQMRAVKFGLIIGMMSVASTALALPTIMKDFQKDYSLQKDSVLTTAQCVVCHIKGTTNMNPYGQDLKKVLDAAKTK